MAASGDKVGRTGTTGGRGKAGDNCNARAKAGRPVVVVDVVVALLRTRNGSTFSRGRFQQNLGGAATRLPSTSVSSRFVRDPAVDLGGAIETGAPRVEDAPAANVDVPTTNNLALSELR